MSTEAVRTVSDTDLVVAAHRSFGERINEITRENRSLIRLFEHYEKDRARTLDGGSRDEAVWPFPISEAYAAWAQQQPREDRLELTQVGPVPMMEPEE